MSATASSRTVLVGSKVGLHARPAALIAKRVKALGATVSLQKGEKTVVANSPLRIISLGAACGDEVTVHAEGEGAEAALEEIAGLVAQDLDADDGDG